MVLEIEQLWLAGEGPVSGRVNRLLPRVVIRAAGRPDLWETFNLRSKDGEDCVRGSSRKKLASSFGIC